MTIVEELDKKSNRPHRSKNIVDALKYLYNLNKMPKNIADAIKMSGSSPAGSNIVGTAKVGEAKVGSWVTRKIYGAQVIQLPQLS